jgi:hypothetical protein
MNFLKTKLSKMIERKTKKSRFLEKTGKKVFQGFLSMKKNKEERIQEIRSKQISNSKSQIPNKSQITISKIKNKLQIQNSKSKKETSEPVWRIGDGKSMVKGQQGSHQSTKASSVTGHRSSRKSFQDFLQLTDYRLLMTIKKLFRFCFNTKLRTTLSLVLAVTLFTTLLFLQNQNSTQNQITVSSLNSEEQFEIKKTKDSLNITGENSSITLNQIKTEKKTLKSILILLKLVTLKPK